MNSHGDSLLRVTKAEQYLLDKIRLGNTQAWSEFVDRYRGRLMSFAMAKLFQSADAEDAVQETFVAFIKNLQGYRGECALETFLFSLLRRKIIDTYRSRKAKHFCLIQDSYSSQYDKEASDPFESLAGPTQTASWYFKADEQYQMQKVALTEALAELVDGFKSALKFRELQIIELLFYCHISNKDTAKILGIDEKNVALIKHRSLKQIRERIASLSLPADPSSEEFENLLTDIWKLQRFSCPKRSTIGAYLLGTLDKQWHDYVDFHLNKLGCRFCMANFEDMKNQNIKNQNRQLRARIMESTAGFLKKP
ncbi:MAG: sigma-70 family RNA polymerase sigma factor [Sedimentisphaerales bacterium]|nr:sigma-70 family RNA polymerase sigma factor [Sedimentisphaerales bacterium]